MILIIIFSIIIALIFIFAISIFVYNNYKQYELSPFSGIKNWNMEYLWNKTNYVNCINLINYIYDLYIFSLQDTLSMDNLQKEIETDFLIENISFIFMNASFSEGIKNPLYNQETYSIVGIIGKIKETNTGIICFRGTKNFTEWIKDSQSLSLISLNNETPYTENEQISETPYFVGMTPPTNPDIKIGYSWYQVFNIISGKKSTHNCICSSECKDNSCKIIPFSKLSKISGLTECSSFRYCGFQTNCDDCSSSEKGSNISSQIIDYINNNDDIDDYIITGHSLGGVLATLTAWNIGPKKVRCIYSFASPKVGNQYFKNNFDKDFEKKMFRIENTNDPVPKLPPGNDYKAVGSDDYVFTATYENKSSNNPYYHSLYDDYLKSFDKIKKK